MRNPKTGQRLKADLDSLSLPDPYTKYSIDNIQTLYSTILSHLDVAAR